MNISHLSCFGKNSNYASIQCGNCHKTITFTSNHSLDSHHTLVSRPKGLKLTNQTQYLEPEYFLPSSDSESYYSKKYSGKFNNSTILCIKVKYLFKREKISRVISILLLSLSFLATALEVKAQPNTESSTLGQII